MLFYETVRSEEDHSLMPGIQAGEIGPKIHNAMGSLDNGWARFEHVRIPRSHMLSRFAQVTEEGQYIRPPHGKIQYGGMVFIRAQMIGSLSWRLAKGELFSRCSPFSLFANSS
jgi:acyl-CoA oxidase